ncbi:oxidoreductase [Chitinophaga niabensis]|uniref:oxidoreductase n=1 Tax=Chitinophaga niabensis TaxID=536979 RepID=UPI0031BA5DDE
MNTLQKPIHSGFSAASTAEDVIKGIDLTGKVAIVTGGYSGIGLETARVLRNAGAQVIVPARDLKKAATTLMGMDVTIEELDLMNPASINAFVDRFLASNRPLHILVNSAGIMANPFTKDTRGYESQFATNHLGHFQLVNKLWPALQKANGARVISVSSRGHCYSPVILEDPNFENREYERWAAYGQSKTANVLFAVELDKRGRNEGIRAFSLHPGSILGTGLAVHLTKEELLTAGVIDENGKPIRDAERGLKTIEQGASTSVWCATSPQLDDIGGLYCEDNDVSPLMSTDITMSLNIGASARFAGVMPYAIDQEIAAKLWSLSEKLLKA